MMARTTSNLCFCRSSHPLGGCTLSSLPVCPARPSPAQPSPAGKHGVVRPCLSAPCSPLLRLCFDRCVPGWHITHCQLSPDQRRGARGRSGGSAQGHVLSQLEGSEAALAGECWASPGAFRHIPVLWPPGSPFALLGRKPWSSFKALQIWWGLKQPDGKGHDSNRVTESSQALTSPSGFRLSCLSPGMFQESNQAGREKEDLVRVAGSGTFQVTS